MISMIAVRMIKVIKHLTGAVGVIVTGLMTVRLRVCRLRVERASVEGKARAGCS